MKQFIEGEERSQVTSLPECLDDYIGEDNRLRVADTFMAGFGESPGHPKGTSSTPSSVLAGARSDAR